MTRNFEEEYKKFAETDVPDLWSRIEAAIDEKREDVLVKKSVGDAVRSKKVTVFTARYAWILAACACLLLTFGALRMIGRSKQTASDYVSEAASASYEEDAESPAYDEAADAASNAADAMVSEAAEEATTVETAGEAAADEDVSKTAKNDTVAQAVTDAEEEAAEDEVVAMAPPAANPASDSLNTAGETAFYAGDAAEAEESMSGDDSTLFNLTIDCRIEDVSGFDKTNTIKVSVTDPLDTDLKAGSVIRVLVDQSHKDEVSGLCISGGNNIYTMTLTPGDDNAYEFVSAHLK